MTTSSAGSPRLSATRALNASSLAGPPGEVGADDQHAVALRGQRPVARDDLLQRARLVGAHLLVADAARRLVGQERGAERAQQVEQRVVLGVGHDRPEDAEPLDAARSSCWTPSATADLPVAGSQPAT